MTGISSPFPDPYDMCRLLRLYTCAAPVLRWSLLPVVPSVRACSWLSGQHLRGSNVRIRRKTRRTARPDRTAGARSDDESGAVGGRGMSKNGVKTRITTLYMLNINTKRITLTVKHIVQAVNSAGNAR